MCYINTFRGVGTSFFPVKPENFPPSYIQDVKNFSVLKPLNSGEALASPVPPPLNVFNSLDIAKAAAATASRTNPELVLPPEQKQRIPAASSL